MGDGGGRRRSGRTVPVEEASRIVGPEGGDDGLCEGLRVRGAAAVEEQGEARRTLVGGVLARQERYAVRLGRAGAREGETNRAVGAEDHAVDPQVADPKARAPAGAEEGLDLRLMAGEEDPGWVSGGGEGAQEEGGEGQGGDQSLQHRAQAGKRALPTSRRKRTMRSPFQMTLKGCSRRFPTL